MWLDLAIIAACASPLAAALLLLNRRDRRRTAVLNAIGLEVAALDITPPLPAAWPSGSMSAWSGARG
jgi:hypothetical protein